MTETERRQPPRSMKFLLAAVLVLHGFFAWSSSGNSTPNASEGWDDVLKKCPADWEEYESALNKLRGSLKREIDAMTQREYISRYTSNDQMLNFVRVHWPMMLSSKDTGWEIYQGCAERNMKIRQSFGDPTATRADRRAKIDSLRLCLKSVFARQGPLPEPFVRLLSCYENRLK